MFDLPAHPLLVHVPVVLLPIAGLMAIAMAIRLQWLERYGWWLVGTSGVGALGAVLAAGSGESLEESVKRSETLRRHAELGESARTVSLVFFTVALIIVGVRWWARRHLAAGRESAAPHHVARFVRSKAGVAIASVALVVLAITSTVTITMAGHQGAKSTWQDVQLRD